MIKLFIVTSYHEPFLVRAKTVDQAKQKLYHHVWDHLPDEKKLDQVQTQNNFMKQALLQLYKDQLFKFQHDPNGAEPVLQKLPEITLESLQAEIFEEIALVKEIKIVDDVVPLADLI